MSRTGAAVSTFRRFLHLSYRQRFELCGFRLTPTVTTFALHLQRQPEQQPHRTFSSASTTSDDDEPNGRKNLDKHKKQLETRECKMGNSKRENVKKQPAQYLVDRTTRQEDKSSRAQINNNDNDSEDKCTEADRNLEDSEKSVNNDSEPNPCQVDFDQQQLELNAIENELKEAEESVEKAIRENQDFAIIRAKSNHQNESGSGNETEVKVKISSDEIECNVRLQKEIEATILDCIANHIREKKFNLKSRRKYQQKMQSNSKGVLHQISNQYKSIQNDPGGNFSKENHLELSDEESEANRYKDELTNRINQFMKRHTKKTEAQEDNQHNSETNSNNRLAIKSKDFIAKCREKEAELKERHREGAVEIINKLNKCQRSLLFEHKMPKKRKSKRKCQIRCKKFQENSNSSQGLDDISRLTMTDLRTRLREHGLSVTGRKQALIERLQATQQQQHDKQEIIATNTQTNPATLSHSLSQNVTEQQQQPQQQLVNHFPSFAKNTEQSADDIFVEYVNGMPQMTIRLPSRNELCQFALKPISHCVGDLLAMLKEEDRGIDRAAIINKHGVRIASSCTIDSLLDDTFSIQINNRTLEVQPPKRDKITIEAMDKVGEVRKVIAQLYEAFNVGEYQLEKSQQLAKELETIRYELEPLEEKRLALSKKAARRTNIMTWMGLGLMSVQFGILARLTWWEYSWDIMEPVTYFVTYGTTMAMYAYYCVTKREYIMEHVKNREYALSIYRNAKKVEFDIDQYNQLKRKTAELEYNLRRIHDPLNMQLPSHLVRTQENTPPIDLCEKFQLKAADVTAKRA